MGQRVGGATTITAVVTTTMITVATTMAVMIMTIMTTDGSGGRERIERDGMRGANDE